MWYLSLIYTTPTMPHKAFYKNNITRKEGFALLITLVVVSVVLAIGLSLLFVTTKQYLLAVSANESEKSFQAAQIGLECLRYWRNQPTTRDQLLKIGGQGASWSPSLVCAGNNPNSGGVVQSTTIYNSSGRLLYNYRYQYTIEEDRCVEPSIYIADLREASDDLIYAIPSNNPDLGQITEIECVAGTICTTIFARGYNRPCNQLDSIYSIQREITVEF